MSEYTYTGIDKTGKRVTGSLNAPTEGELRVLLRSQGIRPTKIGRASDKTKGTVTSMLGGNKGPSVPADVMLMFTRQLYVLVSAGIPLIQAIETLADQSSNVNMKIILNGIQTKISQGSYFWEALAAYPLAFPKLFISLIRAGESSGSLDEMLQRLTGYMEDADRLKKLLKGAMIYPIAVVTVGVGVIGLMMVFVIPKFEEMLKGAGQELPAFTQLVLNISHFMVNNIVMIMGTTVGSVYLVLKYFKSPDGRAFRDRMFFNAPVFGPIMQKGGVARFARTLQTLLSSGVSLLDAIDICRATVDNAVIESAVSKIRTEVEQGNRLGQVVNKLDVFPKMAVQMIAVGESSGSLDQMLEKVADFYEAEVEAAISGMTKLIEPFILVFLGGTVGGLLIAMYLPIFKLAGGASE